MSLGDVLTAIRRHTAGVLVDTNLVLLLLAGTVDRELIGNWKRTQAYVQDDFELLSDMLEVRRGLLITPHIATEVSNLATSLAKPVHARFFELFAGYLRECEERAVALREVAVVAVILV